MLRRAIIGIAAVVALLIAGALALVAFVDVNRFKPQIEQTARQQLHRRLAIEGDLSLAVFPRIALRLPRTTLFDRDGRQTLLALDSARVGVALLPLLRGRVEVDRIRVEGLKAQIRRAADGSTNIDDLLQRDRPAPAERKAAESTPRAVVIGGIEVVDAEVALIEPARVTTLTKLALETGRIAPGAPLSISASTRFSLSPSKVDGEARLKAELTLDPAARAYGAKDVEVEIKGRLDRDDVELKLTSPRLQMTADSLRGDPIALALKRGGSQPAEVKLNVASFGGTAKSATIDRIDLAASLQQGARRITADLAGPAQLSVDAQTLTLPKLAGAIAIDDPAFAAKSLKMALTAALALDARRQALDLRADAKLDATALAAKIGVEDFSKPRIAFDLHADQLDLDRYLTPAQAGKPGAAAPAQAGKPAATAPAQIDLSGLRALKASGQIGIAQLQARGIRASDVQITAKVAGGRADIAPISARLYGGTLNGAARAGADGNRVGIDAALANVALGPLLKDALQKVPIEGRGNVNLALATAGATADAMKRALGGSAKLQIRDGAVHGIDIARRLREVHALIGGASQAHPASTAEKTDFSELNVSFALRDGVASSDDLDLKSPLLRVNGAGKIDLGQSRIDYIARVAVVGTLTGQDGRALAELRGVTIPVRLAGPFDQLSYNIDWGGVAREALKSKLSDELKKRVAPRADEPRKTTEERARDALKGLLGR